MVEKQYTHAGNRKWGMYTVSRYMTGGGGYVQAGKGARRSLLGRLASVQGELGALARGALMGALAVVTNMHPFALLDLALVIIVVSAVVIIVVSAVVIIVVSADLSAVACELRWATGRGASGGTKKTRPGPRRVDGAAGRAGMAGLSGHIMLPHIRFNDVPRLHGLEGSSMTK